MKIKKSIILGASAAMASCFILAACGSAGTEGTTTTAAPETAAESTESTETTATEASESAATDERSSTAAENETGEATGAIDKNIVGDWVSREFDGSFIYTFNEDGKGNYDAAGTQMPFTFTMDSEKLSILYDGDTAPFETPYKIDGNTLTIQDSLTNDVIYDKK